MVECGRTLEFFLQPIQVGGWGDETQAINMCINMGKGKVVELVLFDECF